MNYYQLNRRLCHEHNSKSYRMTFGSCGTQTVDKKDVVLTNTCNYGIIDTVKAGVFSCTEKRTKVSRHNCKCCV